MPRVDTIIVGGGIAATNPFTIGALPFIVNNAPASISATSVAFFTTGTGGTKPAIIIGATATDPQPGASEKLRIIGGLISEGPAAADSTVIGRNAIVVSLAVAIGQDSQATASNNVAVGHQCLATAVGCTAVGGVATASGNGCTAIGSGATTTAQGGTCVGQNSSAAQNGTAVGAGANSTGLGGTAFGTNTAASAGGIAIGNGASSNGFQSVSVGFNALPKDNGQFVMLIGGNAPTMGAGATGAIIVIGSAFNTAPNISHAKVICIGGTPTTFAANTVQLGNPDCEITQMVVGRGDTTTTAVGAGLTIRGTNGSGTNIDAGPLTVIAPRSTGNITTGKIVFQTGAVQASGATLQPATTQFEILPSAGGAGVAAVNFANMTNGAAAQAGTLANSPVAGNPTFWFPVQINGVVKHVPAW